MRIGYRLFGIVVALLAAAAFCSTACSSIPVKVCGPGEYFSAALLRCVTPQTDQCRKDPCPEGKARFELEDGNFYCWPCDCVVTGCKEGEQCIKNDKADPLSPNICSPTPGEPTPSPTPSPVVSPTPGPSPVPTPVPGPTPSPTSPVPSPSSTTPPSASPSTSPEPDPNSPIAVKLHECPDNYPRKPDHVRVGRNTRRAGANPFAWLINLVPEMNDSRFCQNENGGSRGVPCEQWATCAYQGLAAEDAADQHFPVSPLASWKPAVRAWGPGFNGDHVEFRSRICEKSDAPYVPADWIGKINCINYYLGNMVVGPDGSPPGHYIVCAAPTEEELAKRTNSECAEFDLTLP